MPSRWSATLNSNVFQPEKMEERRLKCKSLGRAVELIKVMDLQFCCYMRLYLT